MQGERAALAPPVRVDLPVTAYVPPDYIAYEASKIDAHRRIARARDLNALGDVKAELGDRFGPPPEPVENLLALQAIRLKAAELAASAVAYRGKRLQLEGLDLDDAWAARLRAAHERIIYFKQRRALSASSGERGFTSAQRGSRLRSMLYLKPVCLTTSPLFPGEKVYEESHRGCGPARPAGVGARVRRLRRRQRAGRSHRHGRRRHRHPGAVRPDLDAGQGPVRLAGGRSPVPQGGYGAVRPAQGAASSTTWSRTSSSSSRRPTWTSPSRRRSSTSASSRSPSKWAARRSSTRCSRSRA